jgi:hypothetical protein
MTFNQGYGTASALQLRFNKVSELIHNSTHHRNLERACVTVHFQEILDQVACGSSTLCSACATQQSCRSACRTTPSQAQQHEHVQGSLYQQQGQH